MKNRCKLLIITSLYAFIISCDRETSIQGEIDYLGDAHLIVQTPPVHYKYAPVQNDTLKVDPNGKFLSYIPSNKDSLYYLTIADKNYPLIITPNEDLSIHIRRADFPQNVDIDGYAEPWDITFNEYLKKIEPVENQIPLEEQNMIDGKSNTLLELSKEKILIARKYLRNTPLRTYYFKSIGEYLVFKVRSIEYNRTFKEQYDTDSARQNLLNEAEEMDFFSLKSLKAQRAGIRDLAHYYARTFGIYDSVNAIYGKELSEYDIKRLAYPQLNERRLELLEYINDRDALAHAKMYLVAERIGEQSLEISTPSYKIYLNEYSEYQEYTHFLSTFFKQIKSVSPGQPAISFTLPDIDGELHRMKDYQNKFVLLDFWAGWCQPCLDEFSYMKDLYTKYSRDELEIIGISTEEDSLVWVQDINRFDLPWPQVYGGNGFDQKTFKSYQGGGIPFYILIDTQGNIARYNDIRPSFNFNSVLDSLLSSQNHQLN